MEEQSIELQVKARAAEAVEGINKLKSKLTSLKTSIDSVTTKMDKNGQVVSKTFNTSYKEGEKLYKTIQKIDKDGNLKTVSSSVKKLSNNLNSSKNSASGLLGVLKNAFTFVGVKRAASFGLQILDEGIDYTEQLNMFNVVFKNIEKNGETTFSKLGKSAVNFQNKLNEAFGTSQTETLYMQGIFQSMAETVGIQDKYAGVMSETSTKLTYDLASLYNKSEKDVAEALRAGVYAGQTKPLRTYGIDVTENTLNPYLQQLGITDRTVTQLNQAEKEILRYYAVLKQSSIAHGDLANTINKIVAYVGNYIMKKLVNTSKSGVKLTKLQ